MPARALYERWWYQRKIALLSLFAAGLELAVVWGVFFSGFNRQTAPILVAMTDLAWIFCGPMAFFLALAAIVFDSRRLLASFSFAVSIGAFFLCGLTKLV